MSFSSRWVSLAGLGLIVIAASAFGADFWQQTITRADWLTHVEQRRVLELDAVRELLDRFEEGEATVTVRFPGGDLGSTWAVNFRDRLVSYGIPSRYIELLPGSGGLDILHVSMVVDG
jgi:hypothetical protein